ncbi:MAG: PEP-CTERM sorting domain-containing protein [Opitutaceae bacterium]
MKAFPALRLLACASLFSLFSVTKTSAQLFYHVVDLDSGSVDSGNNLGVAVDITFNFNPFGSPAGTLEVIIVNRAGTAKNAGEGGGNYTTGILTGFGFDLPGTSPLFDVPVLTYKAGTFENRSTNDPDGIDFVPSIPYVETNPEGTFDFGAASTPPPIANGLAAGKTATFWLQLEGSAANFTNYFNTGGFFASNGSDADFGFRFQAIPGNVGSDKFVYYDNPPIPEPSTYGIVATGLLVGIVGFKRARARKAAVV